MVVIVICVGRGAQGAGSGDAGGLRLGALQHLVDLGAVLRRGATGDHPAERRGLFQEAKIQLRKGRSGPGTDPILCIRPRGRDGRCVR